MAKDVAHLGALLLVAAAIFFARRKWRREGPAMTSRLDPADGTAGSARKEPDSSGSPLAPLDRSPLPAIRDPRVVIRKCARELVLYDDGEPVKRCRIALGGAPVGRKRFEGDRRTPEGSYYVCTRNDRSRYRRFLGLSYPGPDDAAAALLDGRISQDRHNAIVAAHADRRRPPWDSPLGGEVGIHGGGTRSDWTQGCIAVADADIDGLWFVLRLGDPVIIEP